MTENYYPINGRITIDIHDHHSKPIRTTVTALTDLDGAVRISYWKINEARTEILLTLGDAKHGDFEQRTFPLEVKEEALPKPGRNFYWSDFSRCWISKSTGVRVRNL
jgi:hypothetical protein